MALARFLSTYEFGRGKSSSATTQCPTSFEAAEERIKKIAEEQLQVQRRFDSVLPAEFVSEFELRFIRKVDSQVQQGFRKNSRAFTAWRAAQKMIVAIGVEPSDWFYYTFEIYEYFYQRKYSFR